MATELRPGVWRIDLGFVNAYLAVDEEVLLVDAGAPWHADELRDGLADAGVSVPAVDRVLVTHYDLDHVGGLGGLAGDLDARVYAHEPDASYLAGERRPPPRSRKGAVQALSGAFVSEPPVPVVRVGDGETVGPFTAYHTPGHTPGHVAYLDERVGFLGDLVRERDGELAPSPWPLSDDTTAVRESIRDLLDRAPRFRIACPGHGEVLRSGGYDALAALD